MKVIFDGKTYLMHWETRKFSPKEGKNTELELEATDCIIRVLDPDGSAHEIARGHVSQTACDKANAVTARRLSFLKAIGHPGMRGSLTWGLRKALGHEYNRTCRVTSESPVRKNRKLRKQVAALKAELAELKETVTT